MASVCPCSHSAQRGHSLRHRSSGSTSAAAGGGWQVVRPIAAAAARIWQALRRCLCPSCVMHWQLSSSSPRWLTAWPAGCAGPRQWQPSLGMPLLLAMCQQLLPQGSCQSRWQRLPGTAWLRRRQEQRQQVAALGRPLGTWCWQPVQGVCWHCQWARPTTAAAAAQQQVARRCSWRRAWPAASSAFQVLLQLPLTAQRMAACASLCMLSRGA